MTAIRSDFVGALDEAARTALGTLGRVRRYRNGDRVLMEGERTTEVAVVLSGRLKIVCTTESGGEIALAVRQPGDLVGELAAIDGDGTPRVASAIALGPTEVRLLRAAEFTAFLTEHPIAGLVLLRTLTGRLRDAERRRVEYGSIDASRRLARLLVELAGPTATDGSAVVTGGMSQSELASLIGASRESVARAFTQLRRLGLVETARRTVVVRNVATLDRFAR